MAFTNTSLNKYAFREETGIVIADSVGANVVNSYSSTITDDLSNKKFLVYLEVTAVSAANGDLDIAVQGSLDGTTFVDLDASVGLSVNNTSTNKAAAIADLSNFYAPYYRFRIFTDGTDILDAGAVTVQYAFNLGGTVKTI